MPALALFLAILLPQQVTQTDARTVYGRVVLISNSPEARIANAAVVRPDAVEMVRAPEGFVMKDPLWPVAVAREAVPPSRQMYQSTQGGAAMATPGAVQQGESVPLATRIALARSSRGAVRPPETGFRTGTYFERLAERTSARPPVMRQSGNAALFAAVADGTEPLTVAFDDDRGLPEAYRLEEVSPAFEIQQAVVAPGGYAPRAATPTPLRIVQTADVTVYFSDGVPVFLRVAPATGGGCYLEYDYGLDGNYSRSDDGVFWLETSGFGRVGVTVPSDNQIELYLRDAHVPGCPLPETLSLSRSGQAWSSR